MDELIEYILNDKAAYNNLQKGETIEEKQLIALLYIRNNVKEIKNMITFLIVVSIITSLILLFF